ncbi:MAG: hypothetical protein JWM19_3095 [Actinomycetia bacterium]|nr:hypothetical protein [Actinomycetes bacterium]
MSDAGVPIEPISRLVGHSDTTTTETVYRHQIRPVAQAALRSWIESSPGIPQMRSYAVDYSDRKGHGFPWPNCVPDLVGGGSPDRAWPYLNEPARPHPETPKPDSVLASRSHVGFVAWQAGNGALANVALDRVQADNARYTMAALLRDVINAGTPPSRALLPLTPEEVAATYAGAEQETDDAPSSATWGSAAQIATTATQATAMAMLAKHHQSCRGGRWNPFLQAWPG